MYMHTALLNSSDTVLQIILTCTCAYDFQYVAINFPLLGKLV
jgi:hypothetical protein